jgi:hypothetical protein
MQIIGHGSLYTDPQNLYPLNFSNFFTNLTDKLGYHSNEIGKKMNEKGGKVLRKNHTFLSVSMETSRIIQKQKIL